MNILKPVILEFSVDELSEPFWEKHELKEIEMLDFSLSPIPTTDFLGSFIEGLYIDLNISKQQASEITHLLML